MWSADLRRTSDPVIREMVSDNCPMFGWGVEVSRHPSNADLVVWGIDRSFVAAVVVTSVTPCCHWWCSCQQEIQRKWRQTFDCCRDCNYYYLLIGLWKNKFILEPNLGLTKIETHLKDYKNLQVPAHWHYIQIQFVAYYSTEDYWERSCQLVVAFVAVAAAADSWVTKCSSSLANLLRNYLHYSCHSWTRLSLRRSGHVFVALRIASLECVWEMWEDWDVP